MIDETALFYGRKANKKALLDFGFEPSGGAYLYRKDIIGGQFLLEIRVANDEVSATVFDKEAESPYYLYKVEGTEGAFVGEVRAEYENTLNAISEQCFTRAEVYREKTAQEVIKYAIKKYRTQLEFLWNDDNAVMRRKDNRKWYAAFLKVDKSKLKLEGEGKMEIIDLRAPSAEISKLVDGVNYLPAYHMNKKSWITVPLDGRVNAEIICALLDMSYESAKLK